MHRPNAGIRVESASVTVLERESRENHVSDDRLPEGLLSRSESSLIRPHTNADFIAALVIGLLFLLVVGGMTFLTGGHIR
jgi:hypothetical protein